MNLEDIRTNGKYRLGNRKDNDRYSELLVSIREEWGVETLEAVLEIVKIEEAIEGDRAFSLNPYRGQDEQSLRQKQQAIASQAGIK